MRADDQPDAGTMGDGPGDAAGYRPVSGLAVAAAVAGAASALVVVSPFFAMLPLVGAALAAAALADVHRAGARKAGAWAALVGLALSVGFAAQAASSTVARRWIIQRRAIAAANLWLEAIRAGRLGDAASMCAPTAFPVAPPGPAGGSAGGEAALAASPTVRAAAACATTARSAASEEPGSSGGWIVRLVLRSCGAEEVERTLLVRIAPTVETGAQGTVERWIITGVDGDT